MVQPSSPHASHAIRGATIRAACGAWHAMHGADLATHAPHAIHDTAFGASCVAPHAMHGAGCAMHRPMHRMPSRAPFGPQPDRHPYPTWLPFTRGICPRRRLQVPTRGAAGRCPLRHPTRGSRAGGRRPCSIMRKPRGDRDHARQAVLWADVALQKFQQLHTRRVRRQRRAVRRRQRHGDSGTRVRVCARVRARATGFVQRDGLPSPTFFYRMRRPNETWRLRNQTVACKRACGRGAREFWIGRPNYAPAVASRESRRSSGRGGMKRERAGRRRHGDARGAAAASTEFKFEMAQDGSLCV
eukprot:357631-Chlamydomonas_euryale.AAC.2